MNDPTHTGEKQRDRIIDLLRSVATTTVVGWHWIFTIIVWRPDGPHPDNPIGYVSGLWCLTWVLQVLPLFFVAGGYSHSLAWARLRGTPHAWRRFMAKRSRQLMVPAIVLVVVVSGIAIAGAKLHSGSEPWLSRGVILILSPLWFLIIFLLLVTTVPLWDRLHRSFGELVPIGLAACTMGVDVLRFHYKIEQMALVNLVFVWAACHQVGWLWERLRAAPVRTGQALALIGFSALVGLTNMGLYPRSMVGTTSLLDRFSNMGPPTLPIIALCCFQVGLVVALRPKLEAWVTKPRVAAVVQLLNRRAMPLFLWHTVGFAVFFAIMRAVWQVPEEPSLLWWVTRPLWVIGPVILTAPLVLLSTRLMPSSRTMPGWVESAVSP